MTNNRIIELWQLDEPNCHHPSPLILIALPWFRYVWLSCTLLEFAPQVLWSYRCGLYDSWLERVLKQENGEAAKLYLFDKIKNSQRKNFQNLEWCKIPSFVGVYVWTCVSTICPNSLQWNSFGGFETDLFSTQDFYTIFKIPNKMSIFFVCIYLFKKIYAPFPGSRQVMFINTVMQ